MGIPLSQKLPRAQPAVSKTETDGQFRFQLLLLLLALLVGALLQILGPSWSHVILERVQLNSVAGLSALAAALLAAVVAHELGHLFAALFLNFEILGGTLGPLRFDWWFRRAFFRVEAGDWSRCSVSAVPREIRNIWRVRMLLVVAAGPAVSFLLFWVSCSIALDAHTAGFSNPWYAAFWSSCAEVNFYLVILGLVPNSRFAAVRNDAALLVSLLTKNADCVDMFRCHQAIELSLRGVRPEYYPESLLLEFARFKGRPYTNLMVARRMLEWAVDSGKTRVAEQWDQEVLAASSNCNTWLANVALAESACFDLLFREDRRAAVRKFAEVEFDQLFPPSLAERAWAARWIACGLPDRAPAHILRAQDALPQGNTYYDYDRMLLDKLHARALLRIGSGALHC